MPPKKRKSRKQASAICDVVSRLQQLPNLKNTMIKEMNCHGLTWEKCQMRAIRIQPSKAHSEIRRILSGVAAEDLKTKCPPAPEPVVIAAPPTPPKTPPPKTSWLW